MKQLFSVACLLCAASAVAIAQEEKPLEPKAPETASEASMLCKDAARTASELKDAEEAITENERRTIRLAEMMKAHDAQYPNATCKYTDENPTLCDTWIQDGKALNSQMDHLTYEHEQALIVKMELKDYLNMRRARLRIMAILDGLTEWEKEVVSCAKLSSVVRSKLCMAGAWEHHP